VKREQCQQMLHNHIRTERQKLLDKYACFDGATYRKGSCARPKNIGDFNIQDHPDIKKYILRRDASELLQRQMRRLNQQQSNRPIEQHPDYSKFKSFFNQTIKGKLNQLKAQYENQPIEQHRDYKKLMNTYACSEGEDENKRYVPCPSCKPKVKLSDFDITDHPDIDKYILKDEAKQVSQQLVDQLKRKYGFFCQTSKSYQPCSKQPKCQLESHPEMSDYVKRDQFESLKTQFDQVREQCNQLKQEKRKSSKKRSCQNKESPEYVTPNYGDGPVGETPPIQSLYRRNNEQLLQDQYYPHLSTNRYQTVGE
jgi:hypothetical protein